MLHNVNFSFMFNEHPNFSLHWHFDEPSMLHGYNFSHRLFLGPMTHYTVMSHLKENPG